MDSREVRYKYLLYSVCFHAFLLILLILFGRTFPAAPTPTTEVVMVRLSRSLGSTESPLLKKTGATAPAIQPTQPPPTLPREEKPAPILPKEKPKVTGTTKTPLAPKVSAKPPQTPPAKSPDERKIAEALAEVRGELQEREAQTQAVSEPSAQNPAGTGSPFGSPGGTISAADPALARYQSQVRSKIIREWIRTASGGEGDPLRTRVVVRINASGNVISTNFAKRSGNDSFDMSALRAVERASPLPPPPAIVMAEALSEGFVVDFSSRMLRR